MSIEKKAANAAERQAKAQEVAVELLKMILAEVKGVRRDIKKRALVEDDFVDIRDMGTTQ